MIAVRKLKGVLTTLINQSRRLIERIILRQIDRHTHAENVEKKTSADRSSDLTLFGQIRADKLVSLSPLPLMTFFHTTRI
jgi:polynucleotide 5'-kinase involved in rRNA processing